MEFDTTKIIKEFLTLEMCAKSGETKIAFKDKSPRPWWISVFFWFGTLFNKRFMTHYATRIGDTIWFPSRERFLQDPMGAIRTIAHENVHGFDHRKYRILYLTGWSYPQCLGLLGFLGLLGLVWTWCYWLFLLFLFFPIPFPAPFRAHFEKRGYVMTILMIEALEGSVSKDVCSRVVGQFTGPAYFWMYPFERTVKQWLSCYRVYRTVSPYKEMLEIVERHKK